MSECEKAKIVGYIEQTPEQIESINALKKLEIEAVNFLEALTNCAHPRWLSIAKTHIQQGMMAAVRAVARPKGD